MCFACTSFADHMTHEELLEVTDFSEAQRLEIQSFYWVFMETSVAQECT